MKHDFKYDPLDDVMAGVACLIGLTLWAIYLGVL